MYLVMLYSLILCTVTIVCVKLITHTHLVALCVSLGAGQ